MPIETLKDHVAEAKIVTIRVWVAVVFMLCLSAGLLSRILYLQVILYQKMSTQSYENRVHLRALPPPRGLIYDTNGKIIVANRPSLILSIVHERSQNIQELLASITELIPISESETDRYKQRSRRGRPFEAIPLKFDLTDEEIALITVNQFKLPGVEINAELVRHYPEGYVYAHSVGYVGRINERELKEIDESLYRGTHSFGKIGLEKYYESVLHGKPGYQEVESNARGRILRVLKQENPVSGQELHLYLDTNLQKTAIDAMKGQLGAIIAMDPSTGGVLAMVSSPSFDPNLFVTGIDHKTYNSLNTSITKPLYNRASLGEYPPASTIKPVMALALLANNIVDASDLIYDKGWFQFKGSEHRFRNWKRQGHGWVDLYKAIYVSNDTYFYTHSSKLGINNIYTFGSQFGLGRKTGIDINEERPGLLPSKAWKRRLHGQPWYPGETAIAIIGQGYMLTTPLQLVEMVSLIANRGKHVQPQLAKNPILHLKPASWGGNINLAPEIWDLIINAMGEVVSSPKGTAYWRIGRGIKYSMAAKTGTAQVVGIAQGKQYHADQLKEVERDHSLFIAFAPMDEPLIAISVILENRSGASNIARKVIDAYLLPILQKKGK
ncbi:MAG: penicillin-binding protein 2 [Candidatus Endonucleobacter bathymodioli]|uniref:Peptidoglycan D,D-transpeptidase MrdA n=1 Tax=Candidatus Endonucleibacter bathymodioli TaxID=539814 RepID=A0AA90NVC4_9GAMM|nr:penicillin-binding protein 2 [Candidatus Endonucleobacter bathymodioli]